LPFGIQGPHGKGQIDLVASRKINCKRYLKPKDVVEGSTDLNLVVLAYIFC
jgi:hypothetical protein